MKTYLVICCDRVEALNKEYHNVFDLMCNNVDLYFTKENNFWYVKTCAFYKKNNGNIAFRYQYLPLKNFHI